MDILKIPMDILKIGLAIYGVISLIGTVGLICCGWKVEREEAAFRRKLYPPF